MTRKIVKSRFRDLCWKSGGEIEKLRNISHGIHGCNSRKLKHENLYSFSNLKNLSINLVINLLMRMDRKKSIHSDAKISKYC